MSDEEVEAVPQVHFEVPPGRTLPFNIEEELERCGSKPLVSYSASQELPETEVSRVPELTALDSDLVNEEFKAQRKSRRTQ